MIDGVAREGRLHNAEILHSQMHAQGLRPNVYTYNALIRAATNAGRPRRALAYHRVMLARGEPKE